MDHAFSVEMKCRKHVSVSSDPHQRVFFEGALGELKELSMVEEAVLEIKRANGVLRIDIGEDDLRKMLQRKERRKKSREDGPRDSVLAAVYSAPSRSSIARA
jgi:hypothetical protein